MINSQFYFKFLFCSAATQKIGGFCDISVVQDHNNIEKHFCPTKRGLDIFEMNLINYYGV